MDKIIVYNTIHMWWFKTIQGVENEKNIMGIIKLYRISRYIYKTDNKVVEMGCSYPIKVKNVNYKPNAVKIWQREQYYFVPCGRCISCQMSKRTWLRDCLNYDLNYYGFGSFTTLTYDDETVPIDKDKKCMVLNYEDVKLFFKRLRENIYRKYGFRKDFSYVCVGELGSENERPHYHLIICGLDWRYDDKIITESWKNGIVKNLPIREGGINYVLKYMEKDQIRQSKHYGFEKSEKPFINHSLGLGKRMIESQMDFIIKHNGCYLSEKRQLRPISSYWMRKLKLYNPKDYTYLRDEMLYKGYIPKNKMYFSKNECEQYRYEKAVHDEKLAIEDSRNRGSPQEDFDEYYSQVIKKEML